MTTMGLEYLKYREGQRSNLATEAETNRSNLAREGETNRHNLVTEAISSGQLDVSRGQLDETKRSNLVREAEANRHNVVTEAISRDTLTETQRSNLAKETETQRHNQVTESEVNRHNQVVELQDLRDSVLKYAPEKVVQAAATYMLKKDPAYKEAYDSFQSTVGKLPNAVKSRLETLGIDEFLLGFMRDYKLPRGAGRSF